MLLHAALLTLLSAPLDAGPAACPVPRAEAAARAASTQYCATVKEGCAVEVREPDATGKRVVLVSLIHSRDDAGRPRFMPEGAQFVDVDARCQAGTPWGHGPRPPPR